MRRYTLYDRLTAIAAGLCLCWLFMACGEDRGGDLPDDDPNSCVVTITLRTSRSARPPQTKAGETITWESDDEYERDITDWLVVAYDESGVLAGYTSSEGTYNKEDENSCTDVNMRLPVGTYRFYAFANLESLEGGSELRASIANANPSPGDLGLSEKALVRAVNILASGNSSIDGRNGTPGKFGGVTADNKTNETTRRRIPMSSYAQAHTLSPAPETNSFKIPLIRMIGKVQVVITNNLSQAITVNRLDIMNLRKGNLPIWLLPWGNNEYLETAGDADAESLAPNLPTGETVEETDLFKEEIISSEENREIPAKSTGGAENHNIKTYTRYIPEGNAGAKEILLGVDIEGRPRTEHTTSFGFVRRNDLLVIPVSITNIETKLEVAEQRLPIGVYPTALAYGEKTGVQILTPVEHTLQATGDLSSFGHRFHHQGVPNRRGWERCTRREIQLHQLEEEQPRGECPANHRHKRGWRKVYDDGRRHTHPPDSAYVGYWTRRSEARRLLHDPHPRAGRKGGGYDHSHARGKLYRGWGEARNANPLHHQDQKLQRTTTTII